MTKNKKLKLEYAEALLLYATTTEQLKSITDRLGLNYMNVGHYMRNNYPAVITQHKALLLSKEKECFEEGIKLLQTTNLSPYQVRKQLDYNGKFIKFVREHHPELQRERVFNNSAKSRPSKVAKYAEAVAMLTELKSKQYNIVKKAAEAAGVNYHALRLHIYTYHRELIGLDSTKNRTNCAPRYVAKYAKAVALLAAEPKQQENFILYVAEKLGLSYHALRTYVYTHHPELAQRSRRK